MAPPSTPTSRNPSTKADLEQLTTDTADPFPQSAHQDWEATATSQRKSPRSAAPRELLTYYSPTHVSSIFHSLPWMRTTHVPGDVLHGRWKLVSKLGEGADGMVFSAVDLLHCSKVKYALKIEERRTGYSPKLRREKAVYDALSSYTSSGQCLPTMWYYGETAGHDFLVIDLLGRSVKEIWEKTRRRMDWAEVARVGVAVLRALEALLGAGFLHRDLKPENVMTGLQENDRYYLVDFGLSVRSENQHGLGDHGTLVLGTPMYMSKAAHKGTSQCARDELESLGYVLLRLGGRKLPWDTVRSKGAGEDRWDTMLEVKDAVGVTELCGRVSWLKRFFEYLRRLGAEEKPDYCFLRRLVDSGSGLCSLNTIVDE